MKDLDNTPRQGEGQGGEEWLQELREHFARHSIRMTPQRIEIYRMIRNSPDHPSAEAIYRRIVKKMPSVSLDTVYRTLSIFESMGLIRRLHLLSDHARFDPDTRQHHHFVCTRCKKIVDFSWPEVDEAAPPLEGHEVADVILVQAEVRGICAECASSGSNEAPSSKVA